MSQNLRQNDCLKSNMRVNKIMLKCFYISTILEIKNQ